MATAEQLAAPPPSAAESRTTTCPDCAGVVSKRAVACPHCGARLAAANVIPSTPQPVDYANQAARINRPYSIAGVIIAVIGVILTIATFPEILGLLFGGFWFLLGIAVFNMRKIHCGRCGYVGSPRVEGGSTLLAIFLLAFFIIPGIIYIALNQNRYFCRKCNQQGH